MDPFSSDTIHFVSYLAILASVLFYLLIAYFNSRRYNPNRADTYLRYRHTDTIESGMSGEQLRATLMASSFSLASAIYVYIDWASADGMLALWSPITWTLGAVVLYTLRKRIYSESRIAWTIHSFLGTSYRSNTLMRLASLVTVLVFLLQVAAEVFVGIAVLTVFFGHQVPLFALCIFIGAVFIAYSVIGGLPSVLVTDFHQYRIIAFAIGVAAVILLTSGGQSAVDQVVDSFSNSFLPAGNSWIIVLSLLCLNIPLFITDMSVWQRIGATEKESDITRGLGSFSITLFLWMSLLVFLGVGFSTYFVGFPDLRPAQAMITYFSDTIVFPILLVGLIGALLSTADTFLISSVQTLIVDWRYHKQLSEKEFDPNSLEPVVHRKMVQQSRIGVLVLGFATVIAGYFFFTNLPSLLDLLFVIFGLQTTLAPIVLWGLLKKSDSRDEKAGILSIVVGSILTIILLVLALAGVSWFGISTALWAPILVLFGSSITFFTVRITHR